MKGKHQVTCAHNEVDHCYNHGVSPLLCRHLIVPTSYLVFRRFQAEEAQTACSCTLSTQCVYIHTNVNLCTGAGL